MELAEAEQLSLLNLVNVYCDESRFSNPYEQYFLIGCVSCPRDQRQQIYERLKKVRRHFGFMPELKWQNVTEAKLPYLNELLQVFFTSPMDFRCIIVDKSKVSLNGDTEANELSFYKFYYLLLNGLFQANSGYYIFLDERTKSEERRIGQLQKFLKKQLLEMNSELKQIQEIKSEESLFIQLLDLLMGAVGYYWNGFRGSPAKVKFINNLTHRLAKEDLKFSSRKFDPKWNQFVWEPKQ